MVRAVRVALWVIPINRKACPNKVYLNKVCLNKVCLNKIFRHRACRLKEYHSRGNRPNK